MLTTMTGFSVFFAVGLLLVVLGFVFEDKLIEVENRVINKFRKGTRR